MDTPVEPSGVFGHPELGGACEGIAVTSVEPGAADLVTRGEVYLLCQEQPHDRSRRHLRSVVGQAYTFPAVARATFADAREITATIVTAYPSSGGLLPCLAKQAMMVRISAGQEARPCLPAVARAYPLILGGFPCGRRLCPLSAVPVLRRPRGEDGAVFPGPPRPRASRRLLCKRLPA
jgi:hypothetical protein